MALYNLSDVVERRDAALYAKRRMYRTVNDGELDLDEGQIQALAAAVVVRREEDPYDIGPLERAHHMALLESNVADFAIAAREPLLVLGLAELDP